MTKDIKWIFLPQAWDLLPLIVGTGTFDDSHLCYTIIVSPKSLTNIK